MYSLLTTECGRRKILRHNVQGLGRAVCVPLNQSLRSSWHRLCRDDLRNGYSEGDGRSPGTCCLPTVTQPALGRLRRCSNYLALNRVRRISVSALICLIPIIIAPAAQASLVTYDWTLEPSQGWSGQGSIAIDTTQADIAALSADLSTTHNGILDTYNFTNPAMTNPHSFGVPPCYEMISTEMGCNVTLNVSNAAGDRAIIAFSWALDFVPNTYQPTAIQNLNNVGFTETNLSGVPTSYSEPAADITLETTSVHNVPAPPVLPLALLGLLIIGGLYVQRRRTQSHT